MILVVFLFIVCHFPRKQAPWGQGLCIPIHSSSANSINICWKSEWINEWIKNYTVNYQSWQGPSCWQEPPPGDIRRVPRREDNDSNLTCICSTFECTEEHLELLCLHSMDRKQWDSSGSHRSQQAGAWNPESKSASRHIGIWQSTLEQVSPLLPAAV